MLKYQIIKKIRLLGAYLFHADRLKDGRTDMMKTIVTLRNFANAPKNENAYCKLSGCNPIF
jgi:hypothetical protein